MDAERFTLNFAHMQATVYMILGAFVAGLLTGLLIMFIRLAQAKKMLRSTEGFLESEKLKKETLQKELKLVYQNKETLEITLKQRLHEAAKLNQQMDEDILLLQKNNEETEALLKAGQPELHALKLQLIEANNNIARLKGLLQKKA